MGEEIRLAGLAQVLRASGDATRLRLINLLCRSSELCVDDLVGITGQSQPKVSRHLAYLRRVGLVSYRKDGLWVYYRLRDDPDQAVGVILEALRQSLGLLDDLEADLEELQGLQGKRPPVRFTHRRPDSHTRSRGRPLPTNLLASEMKIETEQEATEPELEVELL
ncbi:MAG: metalloregulator ArsR/SmtB family transcription factor [Acidobacteriota bacterium]